MKYSTGNLSTTPKMTKHMAPGTDTANNGCTDNAWSRSQDQESLSALALNGFTTTEFRVVVVSHACNMVSDQKYVNEVVSSNEENSYYVVK